MKKFVKICLISLSLCITFALCFGATYLTLNYFSYSHIPLNADALASNNLQVEIFDFENKKIKQPTQLNTTHCDLSQLQAHTIGAFISIEDKTFYKHHGINTKRIVRAAINNLKSKSFKEGASTISQQLIKNTHLSNEKTIKRKLKEIALTKKLEKQYSKDEILQCYLNVIYFGNNCYGLEEAANYYFNKPAKELDLNESCTLAGIIKAPSKFCPVQNYDNCLKRRNLILSEMEKDGKISVEQKISTQNKPISLCLTPRENATNTYAQASIDEAAQILNIPTKQLATNGYKIHTYCKMDKQNQLSQILDSQAVDGVDNSALVIDNASHGIVAYDGNSIFKLSNIKRQPASCIKPVLVYGPALNENIISPSTQILDEPLTIGNYSPSNVNKKFAGYISVTDAVKNSVNIPAIKVLSYVGLESGKQYAQKMGLSFAETDDSYAIALGGMTYGTTLKTLTSAYTTFANGGIFAPATFVQYITDKNDQLVYIHKPAEQMVLRQDSAYLMTHILQEAAKTGTAKKLADLTNVEVASKTGTTGDKKGNTDAYNISYTPEETIGVWFGNLDNTPSKIAGGNQPTTVAKEYLKSQTYQKTEFEVPSSITTAKIDSLEKETNHTLKLANKHTPERYTETAVFSRFNMPSEFSPNFSQIPQINANCEVKNGQIVLNLAPQKHICYQIYKNDIPYQSIQDKKEKLTLRINFPEKQCQIKIVANYANNTAKDLTGEKVFNLSQTKQNAKPKDKWYI